MDTLFLMCAVVGGTVLLCQFALTLLGIGDHDGDVGGAHFDAGGDVGDFHAGADFHAGDFDAGGDVGDFHAGGDVGDVGDVGDAGDFDADHSTSLSHASEADVTHTSTVWLFEMISLRTVIAAIAFFGVAGKASLAGGLSEIQSLIIALVVGWLAMYAVYCMLRGLARLQSSGNIHIAHAVGKHGAVYVPIPGNHSGAGKVTLKLQSRTMEYQALTSEQENIPTGTSVVVTRIVSPDTVEVSRLTESVET